MDTCARSDGRCLRRCEMQKRNTRITRAVSISSACTIDTSRTHHTRHPLVQQPLNACSAYAMRAAAVAVAAFDTGQNKKCQYKLKSINLEVNLMLWAWSTQRGESRTLEMRAHPTTCTVRWVFGEPRTTTESIGDWQRRRQQTIYQKLNRFHAYVLPIRHRVVSAVFASPFHFYTPPTAHTHSLGHTRTYRASSWSASFLLKLLHCGVCP